MKHDFARKLRRDQTDVERKLWFSLRGRRFHRYKFRRQQPIGPYIVDFVCFESRLIIELDGGQHSSAEIMAYDGVRARFLEKDGFQLVRFFNREINVNFDGVLEAVEKRLRKNPSPARPCSSSRAGPPLPQGERGKKRLGRRSNKQGGRP